MSTTLRAGIAGAGFISDYHIQGLQEAGAEVVCVASRTLEKARAKASQFGVPEATDDVVRMLRRDDLDLMVIATPDATHEELALIAIGAGRPVLLQKPMALTAASAVRILEAADRGGVPLFVSFMHRYFEEVITLKRMLQSGDLGTVLTVRQRNATRGADWASWFYDSAQSGGVVAQLGVHGIDLLRYLFGEIEAVAAVSSITESHRELASGATVAVQTADTATAVYRFENGMTASHEMSYREVAGTDRFRMEVYGEQGTAWLRTERGLLAWARENDGTAVWQTPDLSEQGYGLRHHQHLLAMVQGDAPDDRSAHDGVRCQQIVEAIEQSSRNAAWTEVPL